MTKIDQLFAEWDELDGMLLSNCTMWKVNDKIDASRFFDRGDYDGDGWLINGCIWLPHAKDDF